MGGRGGNPLNRGKEDSGDYAQCLVKASKNRSFNVNKEL